LKPGNSCVPWIEIVVDWNKITILPYKGDELQTNVGRSGIGSGASVGGLRRRWPVPFPSVRSSDTQVRHTPDRDSESAAMNDRWTIDELLSRSPVKSMDFIPMAISRDVNLSVLCLTYRLLHGCLVCLFRAWKGDRQNRHAIDRPDVLWNSGVDKSLLVNCWDVNSQLSAVYLCSSSGFNVFERSTR
jgi:hypothetical protein